MTDRMAALERVAEAARQMHVTRTSDGLAAAIVLRAALDALDALPAEPVGETVEVRAGVYRDRVDNRLCVSDLDEDFHPADFERIATITARVPLPAIPTVAARVEG